ncbi:peptidase C65 Otubain-domain-containing protein [Glomus cerebriforme]|uniref:ubiquitinyl hydrolase 1 n=1 Tax=Glomus cerebriforme TaxID=658196 RepID=A0A397SIQ2_9GLOM|nr:peptidase C65 Otubain-domain-containing protein [Glomus cerebriforme]
MNMGGGENYDHTGSSANSGTPTQKEINASVSNSSEHDSNAASEHSTGTPTPSGSEEKENAQENEPQQNEPVQKTNPLSESGETSKEGEETQQTVAQEKFTPQQNWEFEQSIKKEEAGKTPLVCLTEDISKLYQEYEQGSEIYRQKIMKLAEKHSKIRRCRGDGNCFYRAFGFAWFERLMESRDKSLRQSALNALTATNSLLNSAGYQSLVYEDAHDIVEKQMKAVANGEHDEDMLLTIFQTDEISNYIVYYLRLITAAYLKLHHEEYEPFLEFEIGMDQFCTNFVEVMDQEADHIHVIALTKALRVPVEIAYMSGSDAMEQVNFHEFYPDEEAKETVTLKPLVLLYRPGHYDILYRRE